jgi:multidrug resistance efflux pump
MPEYDIDQPRPKTKVYGVLLAAVVAIASLVLIAITQEPKSAVSSPGPPETVSVPQIASTKSEAEILFRGKSAAVVTRKIALPFGGEITNIGVNEGAMVRKDDVLATYAMDRESMIRVYQTLYPERVQSLKKTVSDYQSELEKTTTVALPLKRIEQDRLEKQLVNLRDLHSKDMASMEAIKNKEVEIDTVKKQILELNETKRQTETALAKATEDLRFYEGQQKRDLDLLEWQTNRSYSDSRVTMNTAFVKAPIAGHIMWLAPELRVECELEKGTPVVKVAASKPMVVRCKVHELDLVRLKLGDRGTVTFDAMPTKKYACKVTRIPWVSRNPALDVPADYEIECVLDEPDESLKDGLTCNVRVHIAQ